jgi:hypothetical protein
MSNLVVGLFRYRQSGAGKVPAVSAIFQQPVNLRNGYALPGSIDRLDSVTFRPTPLTAAIAGAFAAAVWPFIWSRFGGEAKAGTVEFIAAILLTIALPAHALVLGLGGSPTAVPGALDTGLFKRIGAWLGAAAMVMLLRPVVGL